MTVRTAGGTYAVKVGVGIYEGELPRLIAARKPERVVVVSHSPIIDAHGERLFAALGAGAPEAPRVVKFLFPPGEEGKNLRTVEEGYGLLLREEVNREDLVVAFGGGVVGDLGGFLAATYMRGLAWIQVPTTLMAMVDSSVGGKVGVDLPGAKNAVGAFYQPAAVFSDVGVLSTLPAREFRCGMAEVVKYGLLYDGELLEEARPWTRGPREDVEGLAGMVMRCVEHKAKVVERDERDTRGERAMLNYGHTFGHALESAAAYRDLRHGEAVALGMLAAARASELAGLAPEGLAEMHRELLLPLVRGLELPPGLEMEAVVEKMRSDKKRGREARFVLLEEPQKPRLVDGLPETVIRRALEEALATVKED